MGKLACRPWCAERREWHVSAWGSGSVGEQGAGAVWLGAFEGPAPAPAPAPVPVVTWVLWMWA